MLSDQNVIYSNGSEHHTLIGASLPVAFSNAGGKIDKEQGLAELRKRSLNAALSSPKAPRISTTK